MYMIRLGLREGREGASPRPTQLWSLQAKIKNFKFHCHKNKITKFKKYYIVKY